MKKQEVQDMVAKLCGALTELGCEYQFEMDNRPNRKSAYIYVRKPIYTEIRVSDHAAESKRKKQFDIGPHGITVEQAIEDIRSRLR